MVTFSDLEEVLVIEPNTVTVLPALAVVGVTPSEIWAAGPVVCARAATDNRLRAASAINHLNENLTIRKILLSMCLQVAERGVFGTICCFLSAFPSSLGSLSGRFEFSCTLLTCSRPLQAGPGAAS